MHFGIFQAMTPRELWVKDSLIPFGRPFVTLKDRRIGTCVNRVPSSLVVSTAYRLSEAREERASNLGNGVCFFCAVINK